MDWEAIIGLEVHAQLLTRSKMFCACRNDYQEAAPNTLVCPVCLGLPGALPTINHQAVEFTIMTGLALNCSIAEATHFDRKNYPYPDLMKGYQVSQYSDPFCQYGWQEIEVGGVHKRIGVTRVHLEEDVAKMQHVREPLMEAYSLVDVNRSGVPLMEVVGEPDLRSPEEARLYLMKLRSIVQYLGVSSGDMEKGSFRCDANISIRPRGASELMPKVEVKNMNSFRAVERALHYEFERQQQVVSGGGRVVQETRGWVEGRGVTVSQRSKEHAHDYRYFPEPDLPPIEVSREWVEELRSRLPELPDARCGRLQVEYGLSSYDAGLLTNTKAVADFFETALELRSSDGKELPRLAKSVSNWITGELARLQNATGADMNGLKLTPKGLMELVDLVESGEVSSTMAKTVFEEMFTSGAMPRRVVEDKGLTQISDRDAVLPAVNEVVVAYPDAVRDYIDGKTNAIGFLVGQVMKLTRGKANPGLVRELLYSHLEALRDA